MNGEAAEDGLPLNVGLVLVGLMVRHKWNAAVGILAGGAALGGCEGSARDPAIKSAGTGPSAATTRKGVRCLRHFPR